MQMDFRDPMAVCNYRVFLSFRGPDTRHNLVEYLYDKLRRLGIVAFLDREEIQYGECIGSKIKEAIKRSDICVPIFSQDFASSPACLMEVTQMVESHKEIHPIFFFVEPCDVRHQRGTYGKSFAKHKSKNSYPESTIKKWEDSLNEIAHKKGLEFKKAALEAALKDGLEASLGENGVIKGPEFKKAALEAAVGGIKGRFYDDLFGGFRELEDFISELWKLLKMDEQGLAKNLVGTERDVPEMMRKLGFDYQNGQIVKERKMTVTGRWVLVVRGQSGVGKTTLAKEVYSKIRHLFEGCSFLENVRDNFEQKRVVSLQKKLIRDLKRGECPEVESFTEGTTVIKHLFQKNRVLIVLDDVDDFEQIEPLAKELTWFGPGSTIILTTTKEDVYKVRKSEEQDIFYEHEHEVKLMDEKHAFELFRECAFGKNDLPKDHEKMSKEIISAVDYLPFAIDFVGRSLYGESEKEWERTLDELKAKLIDKVKKMLLANYELLSYEAKQVFLDIACFFTGIEKTMPCYMWAARGLGRGVEELKKKSFLKIKEEKEFWMQGQLILLGREIVEEENHDNPRKRSRLWDYKDVQKILREKKGIYKVISLRVASNFKRIDGEAFRHLSNLRFLELDKVDIEGNPENILPNLEWLDWCGCQEKSKLFAFDMEDLVILNLCSSSVQLSLKDWEQLMEKAQSLKVLNLKDCTWINASLEFPASRHLKCLIVEGCLYLKPNETISNFENLVSLNMKHCKWVKDLPQALLSMKALKELLIDGTTIAKLQFEEGSLPALEILSACECKALREVSDSIGLLKSLRKLALSNCRQLNTLPHVFGELRQMQKMDLSYTSIDDLPPCVKNCNKLQVLKMARTFLQRFPEAIEHLEELKELDFTNCRNLSGRCNITRLISLRILRLKGTNNAEVFPRDKAQLRLHILELDHHITKQTQTSQKNSCVSNYKRKRDEE